MRAVLKRPARGTLWAALTMAVLARQAKPIHNRRVFLGDRVAAG